MINVTRSFLPPKEEYVSFLKRIWYTHHLTNRGPLVLELESKLKEALGVKFLTATTNGTIPIQLALKLLPKGSEVITTPFSYVATTSTIVWEGLKPIYVDIEPEYLTLDPSKIEEAITPETSAILATHVYGNPCDVEKISKIAKKNNLLVIYDAAHTYGVKYNGKSIFQYGDVSTCSFHATKIFHTGEGGCWVTKNDDLHQKLFFMHKFGHDGPIQFRGVGINAKMSELQAAMGLAVFPYFDEIVKKRKAIYDRYLSRLQGNSLKFINIRPGTEWNYHYIPVLFENEEKCLKVQDQLKKQNINTRRYFYPSLNKLDYISGNHMPVSENIAPRILCLPIFYSLDLHSVDRICDSILKINLL